MITYYKLPNGNGSLSVDTVFPVDEQDLTIYFDNAKEGAKAVVTIGAKKYYRPIVGGCVTVPMPEQSMTVFVTYAEDDVSGHECTPLDVLRTADKIFVKPNMTQLNAEIALLHAEAQKLIDQYEELQKQFELLKTKFDDLYEGYNVI